MQKTISIAVNTSSLPSTSPCFKTIDTWLSSAFELNITPFLQNNDLHINEADEIFYELAYRSQQLSQFFLRLTNIPAFYCSKNIQLIKDDASISMSIPIAFVEFINIKAYEIAVILAFDVLYWLSANQPSPSNSQLLHKIVEQKINKRLATYLSGSSSALPILKSAHEKNIPFIHTRNAVYQLGWGSKSHLLSRTATEYDSEIGARRVQNKKQTIALLNIANLPAPNHIAIMSKADAHAAARDLGWPVVLKPINLDRGEGVTIDIDSHEKLSTAFDNARKLSTKAPLLIEESINGTCHRIFISNGQLLYSVKRWPISAIGDGQRTVEKIITDYNNLEKNKSPWLKPKLLPNDNFAKKIMSLNDFSMESIPKPDEHVPLRPFDSADWRRTSEDVTDIIHSDNVAIAIRSAELFGLYNAGIDIISTDISQPWHSNNAAIIEVNYAPSLGASSISKQYLDLYFEKITKHAGRIPVYVFSGGSDALDAAKTKQHHLINEGLAAHLTTHNLTVDGQGKQVYMVDNNLSKRCFALLLNKQVDSIIVVIQTDECLFEGLPFDQIDSFHKTDEQLHSWKEQDNVVPPEASLMISNILNELVRT